MKRSALFSLTMLLCIGAYSQVPQGFNYQAVARDASGNPLVNQSLPVKLTIQADSLGTIKLWQEEHLSATSNAFGLISVVIGRGCKNH